MLRISRQHNEESINATPADHLYTRREGVFGALVVGSPLDGVVHLVRIAACSVETAGRRPSFFMFCERGARCCSCTPGGSIQVRLLHRLPSVIRVRRKCGTGAS